MKPFKIQPGKHLNDFPPIFRQKQRMAEKLLIICFNDLKNDARVMRQINFVKDTYDLTVLCFDAHPTSEYEIIRMDKTKLTFFRKAVTSVFLLLGFYAIANRLLHDYEKRTGFLKERRFDIIIANDVETLPLSAHIAGGKSKIFLDAHEYAPRQFEDRLYWRIFFKRFTMHLCRKYLPVVQGMSTINAGLARAYEREFSMKPEIITNATYLFDLPPLPRHEYPIRLVHHGIFTVSRQPDIMIDLMNLLDERFTLDLIYLIPGSASAGTKKIFETFTSRATATGKIRVLPPLKGSEIVPTLHQKYDMGIILVPPVNFNYENGLPNKLFDCIQARLGMAVGPLREIASITHDYAIGVVSKDFTARSMADAIGALTLTDISQFKQNADIAARELNAERNKERFLDALKKL